MSEFDSLIEGYPGLDDPSNDPGPLSEAESEALVAEIPALAPILADEPPIEPGDWPEEEAFGLPVVVDPSLPPDSVELRELRALKPDQRPVIGQHYVIYGGIPRPVARANLSLTEDEFVRANLDVEGLRDQDGQRRIRADRTLRLRYRGYVCGEMTSL